MTPRETKQAEKENWEAEFEELQFISCPTEEKDPFFWRWTEEGNGVLKSFIRQLLAEKEKEAEIRGAVGVWEGEPLQNALADEYERGRQDAILMLGAEDVIAQAKKEEKEKVIKIVEVFMEDAEGCKGKWTDVKDAIVAVDLLSDLQEKLK